MSDYFYKSSAPTVVAVIREFYAQRDTLDAGLVALGKLFDGKVARMRNITSLFAGGVKFSNSADLDTHWRRPDEYGYRTLRSSAKPGKGISKEARADINKEHERLLALWKENCPPELDTHHYWGRLGVNTGNLMLGGGVKFELDGTAYFHLGFPIDRAEHDTAVAAGKPTSGWIEGAAEILASEYQAARSRRNELWKEAAHA
ncbi:hypothetical protein TRE132_14390 [Pseudomonas chlororaphis subsp. aurantiaca]|nr:hypothetical protein TRE132_14390 [Pseudomonas chlororaphis subsp. aurantiaca]